MKMVAAMVMGTSAAIAFATGNPNGDRVPHPPITSVRGISNATLTTIVERYCQSCHNETQNKGNLSLKGYDVDAANKDVAVTEKMIRKLRAGMMPPPGSRRPTADTMLALV